MSMPKSNALHLHELQSENWGNTAPSPVQFTARGALQLVLGPNEAGKTTLMRAIRGFVRGLLSTDPAPRLLQDAQVKARVSLCGTEHWLHRQGRDGAGGALRDQTGGVVPPEFAWPAPGQVVYDSLFCLDHDTLREGGRQLGRSDTGELGTLLFATLADAGRLAQVKKKSDSTLSSLFNPAGNARKQRVNASIRGVVESEKTLRESRVTHQDHGRRKQELAAATTEAARIDAAWNAADARMRTLDGLARQLPSLTQLRENESLQAAVRAEGPTPDPAWAQEALDAQQALKVRQDAQATAETERTTRANALAAVQVDETILGRAEDIRGAHDLLDAHSAATAALPSAQLALDTALPAWEAALRAVGFDAGSEAPAEPLPSATDLAELRGALAALAPALATKAETQAAVHRAEAALAATLSDWDPTHPAPQASASLVEALAAARQDQAGAAERTARAAALDGDADALLRAAAAQRLTLSDPADLQALALPSAVRRTELVGHLLAAEQAVQRAEQRGRELHDERKTVLVTIQDGDRHTDAPSAETLQALREARDTALQEAFADPTRQQPSAWRALAEADHAADQRYREAEALGAMEARQSQLERIEGQAAKATADLAQAQADRAALDRAWTEEAKQLGLPLLSVAELPGWLDAVQALQTQENGLRNARETLASETAKAEARLAQLRAVLVSLQEDPGIPLPSAPSALLDAAEQVRDQIADAVEAHQRQKAAWQAAENTLQEAAAHHAGATKACSAPEARWAAAKAAFDPSDRITPDGGSVWIEQLAAAQSASDDLAAARERVDQLAARIEAFVARAAGLAALADPHLPPAARTSWLNDRLTAETERAKTRSTRTQERDRAQQKLEEAEAATTSARAVLDALVVSAGLAGPDAVDAARDRAGRLGALQSQAVVLRQALGDSSPDEVEDAVDGRSLTDLEADRDTAGEARADWDGQRATAREAVRTAQAAFDAVDGTAAAAEAAQDRANHQSAAEEAVEALLLERACAYLTGQLQDELAREAQTGPVDRAGEVFSTLTLGAFQGLQVEQRDEGGTPLRYVSGLRNNGERVAPQQMSDGTRDALWLSLRVAAIEDLLDKGHRVPVVLDDVAVHLDDSRTRAMLQVFAELAQKTQVLLFTHHRAVVEAAEAAGVPHETLTLAPRSLETPPMNLNPPDPGPRPETPAGTASAPSSRAPRTRRRPTAPQVDLTAIVAHLKDHPDGCGKRALLDAGLVDEADWSRVRAALEDSDQVKAEGQKRGRRYLLVE